MLPALEDDKRSRATRLVALQERLHLGEVVRNREPVRARQALDVRFAGFELPVPEAMEDRDEDRWVSSAPQLGREVQIKGDYWALIVLPGDVSQILATDERALGERGLQGRRHRDLFGRARHRARCSGSSDSPFTLLERLPGARHLSSFRS